MPFSENAGLLISIKTWRNTWVSADQGGGVNQQDHCQAWENWGVSLQSDGSFAFLGSHGQYMSAMNGGVGAGINQQGHIQAWEKWRVSEPSPGQYNFLGAHGMYLSAWDNGNMVQQNHAQAWETFTIEVLSACEKIYDVVYTLDQTKIMNKQPKSLSGQTLVNESNDPQQMTMVISQEYSTTSSWSQTDGIKVGVKVSMEAGIPDIGKASVEVSTEVSHEFTSGAQETTTGSFSSSLPMTVPPRSSCTAVVNFTESSLDVPWKAKAQWKGMNNQLVVTTIGGTWSGTTVYDIQYTIQAPVHI